VVIGEKASRYAVLGMMILSYLLTVALVAVKFFTPVMLVVLLALPSLKQIFPAFLKPKPEECPPGFPKGQGGWPLYFAPLSFVNNRSFGMWFLLGLLVDVVLRLLPATAGFWR
jgi:1,4-dihydroxy-2-naphthoate octaprenyltransferase